MGKTTEIREKLEVYYNNDLFKGTWTRINDSGEITGFDEIITLYLDKLLLFIRVNWDGEPEYAFEVCKNLMTNGKHFDHYS